MKLFFLLFISIPIGALSQESLYKLSLEYEPSSVKIDSSYFSNIDFEIDSNNNVKASFIILCKQYYYHLKCCHQSYDLLRIFHPSQDKILSLALDEMKLDRSEYSEGIGSWMPYEFLIDKKLYRDEKSLKSLLVDIKKERKNIENGKYWENDK